MVKVLFVCLGNICRSPTAEGVFKAEVEKAGLSDLIESDSAGTSAWHVGNPPDERAIRAAGRRGIDISGLRARQVTEADFQQFDYVLAMDKDNLQVLTGLCPPRYSGQLSLFLDYAAEREETEVPDPYYGGEEGFERVLELIGAASEGLLADIRRRHLSR